MFRYHPRFWLLWLKRQWTKRRLYPRRPLFYETRNYFHWLRARLEARAWLRANSPDAIAARCMWGLNRHARMGSGQHIIYPLKSALIRTFFERGLCRMASLQRQKLVCWRCGGSCEDPEYDGDCLKCGGSGVYRTICLYRFVFEISGRRYVWHQPADLVDWLDLSEYPAWAGREPGKYDAHAGEHLDAPLTWLYAAAVVEYLGMRGVAVDVDLPTLRGCLWWDWRDTDLSKRLRRLKYRWQDLRDDVGRLLEFARTGHLPPSNRIPF